MKFRWDNCYFFSESNIELEEKSIEEKNMIENLEDENEAYHSSKLSTKKDEGNINLTEDQILSDENPIPVSWWI